MRGRKIIEAVQLEHNFTYGEIYDKNRIESWNELGYPKEELSLKEVYSSPPSLTPQRMQLKRRKI